MKYSETGLYFLGGALLGAAAMYILDPDAGERRRQVIGAKTGDALRGTGDRLGDAWGQASRLGAELISHAQDLGGHLADHARSAAGAADQVSGVAAQASDARDHAYHQLKGFRGRIAELGHDLLGRARHAASHAGDTIEQAQQAARDSTHSVRHKIAHAIDPDHDGHAAGHAIAYTGAGIGAVALGAAAMYLMDPAKGRERRDFVVNQVSKCVQETGHVCRLAGQYVMRLWHGQTGNGQDEFQPADPMAGEQLVQRVRQEISPLLTNPAQIQLMADADGMVTLYGKIPPSELDTVLIAINNVPGVRSVLDRLDAPGSANPNSAPRPIESAPQL